MNAIKVRRHPAPTKLRTRLWLASLEDRSVPATFTVSTTVDGAVNAPGDLPGSLRQAIFDANLLAGADSIVFDATTFATPQFIIMSVGELAVTGDVAIAGPGKGKANIEGTLLARHFNIDGPGTITVSISDLTLSNGGYSGSNSTDRGGSIFVNDEKVSITNVDFMGNQSFLARGGALALLAAPGELTVTGSKFINNSTGATLGGGAIDVAGGKFTLSNSTLSGNSAGGRGGAIYLSGASTSIITNTNFDSTSGTGNLSSTQGGAIAISTGILQIIGGTFDQNSSTNRGGVGYIFGSAKATISSATITANTASNTASGGAICVASGGSLLVSTTSFTNNKSTLRGGALYFTGSGSAITVSNNCTFTTNSNGANGGGAVAGFTGTFTCQDSTFTGNSASGRGGALYFSGGSTATILRTTVSGSTSTSGGGGIGHQNGFLTVQDCTVTGNTSPSRGGGIYTNAVTAFIDRSLVNGNTAGQFGGGICLVPVNSNALPVVRNCTLTGNTAARFGGGIDVYLGYGVQTIIGCTIVGNVVTGSVATEGGGGLSRHGSGTGLLTVESCIIANNTNSVNPDALGAFTANNNLVEITTGATLTGTGNVVGLDPNLGSITNNGGLTQSFLPNAGSPAINAGKNSSPGAAFDQRGSGFTRSYGKTDIGSIEVIDPATPNASTPLVNITATSDSAYIVTVTYTDDTAIDTGTLDGNDIRITGPNAFNQLATFVSFTGGPGVVVATYSFNPPGGIWDGADLGTYTVSLELGQVSDTLANAVPSGALGNFLVDFGRNLVVTTTANAGVGSLRQALLDANFSLTPDTITFDPIVFPVGGATITLSAVIPIDSPVTISGLGASRVTISGNDVVRIFQFNNLPGQPTSAISNVTLTKGRTTGGATTDRGAAIFINNGSDIVNIANVTFTSNKATGARGGAIGINTNAIVTISGSTFTGNQGLNAGGAITLYGNGNLTVTDSTFTTNASTSTTSQGGAVFVYSGTFTADRVTLSSNTSGTGTSGGGAAIAINQPTGAVNVVTIRNSTISTNAAGAGTFGGGGILVSRTSTGTLNLKVQNTTIVLNTAATGGGVSFVGAGAGAQTIAFDGTIIAKNTGTAPDVNGAINANFSLIGLDTGATISGSNNVIGTGTAVDPLLGPLASNGGLTKTHALLLGSPAIDAGSNVGLLGTDQRGGNRVIGTQADIGSYEFSPGTPAMFVVTNLNDNGAGSLRQAIIDANTNAFATDTITFNSGLNGTITLTSGEMTITDSLTITGLAGGVITISGNNASRIFNISDLTTFVMTVTITDLNLTAGNAADDGGAVFVENESLTLDRVVITNSTTAAQGGGIGIGTNGALVLRNSTVSGNTAPTVGGVGTGGYGGGIYFMDGGDLTIDSSTVSGNSAARQGGGVYFFGKANSGSILVRNSTISGNSSGTDGGGIIVRSFTGDLTVRNSTIAFNTAATGSGGGISLFGATGTITLDSSIVAKNVNATAPDVGGKVSATFSLVGNATGATLSGSSNKVGVDPLLGALANNGGLTQTHALLAGSPALNNGANSQFLTTDQRGAGFNRSVGQTDIGAFEVQTVAAKVNSVSINSKLLTPVDKAQRSYVSDVAITFDSIVTFTGTPASAFTLDKVGGGSVTLSANVDNTGPGTVVTLTFTGGSVNFTSLADGRYALHVLTAGITGGLNGGDFIFDEPAPPTALDMTKIFRVFGDYTGDGVVASIDFIQFRLALGSTSPPFQLFDFDNDGAVAASDFIQFRLRFGGSI